MKKFIAILLIICTFISNFNCIVYANDYQITPFDDIPKKGSEHK